MNEREFDLVTLECRERAALRTRLADMESAVDALMAVLAAERPLREPETSSSVLLAWDALYAIRNARLPSS